MSWTLLFFFSGIAHSKIIDLNWSYKALAQKEALTLCQDRAFASFSCVLSLALALGRFIRLHCHTGSWGRGAPLHGKKSHPLLPHIPNIYICCKNIIEGKGIVWVSIRVLSFTPPLIDTLSFQYMKVVKVVHTLGKFYWYRICCSPVLNSQMFLYQHRILFMSLYNLWDRLPTFCQFKDLIKIYMW